MRESPQSLKGQKSDDVFVQGREEQPHDSTSYYNIAEVQEVVDRVTELLDRWPTADWGAKREDAVAVVTPYFSQVKQIRQAFRSKGRTDLKRVVVERITNMQGAHLFL